MNSEVSFESIHIPFTHLQVPWTIKTLPLNAVSSGDHPYFRIDRTAAEMPGSDITRVLEADLVWDIARSNIVAPNNLVEASLEHGLARRRSC